MKIIINVPDMDTPEVQQAVEKIKTRDEIEKVNAVCFWLIRMAEEANSATTTITQEKVHVGEKQLGDWKITIKKLPPRKD